MFSHVQTYLILIKRSKVGLSNKQIKSSNLRQKYLRLDQHINGWMKYQIRRSKVDQKIKAYINKLNGMSTSHKRKIINKLKVRMQGQNNLNGETEKKLYH